MKAPISWLEEFVDIKLKLPELMWKLTEVGLTTESFTKTGEEIVLENEVTPNRPDWLSILGIAREIAAIENTKIKTLKVNKIPKLSKLLPLNINIDYKLSPRYSGIIIANVVVKPSPEFIQKRLKLVGLRPINNLVDITNYVMLELGIPIHVFDYDKFLSKNLTMKLTKGGEKFTSVDELSYVLPKGTIIIQDLNERVIDLCGIKGGGNTGISNETKNIFIHVPIYNPILIRKTSQALKLSSDASYIYERGANAGGTLESLKRCVSLILKYANGSIASEIIDKKYKEYKPSKISFDTKKIEKILGIKIPDQMIKKILNSLNLSPNISRGKISCLIPTYRGDLKIEEDIIEEIARIYGYNNFPRTLPVSQNNAKIIPYFFDNTFHLRIKNLMVSSGFSETMNLSLISKELINSCKLSINKHLKIINPISNEYEYLRNSLMPSLINAIKINTNEEKLLLFEIGKVYIGSPDKHAEPYKLAAITKNVSYRNLKGIIDLIFFYLNIQNLTFSQEIPLDGLWHPNKSFEVICKNLSLGYFGFINPQILNNLNIKDEVLGFEFDLKTLEKCTETTIFKPIPKYPSQIEDLTFVFPEKTRIGEVIKYIKDSNSLISNIELVDIYKNSYTFKIWYQHPSKTLTDKEVKSVHDKLVANIQEKFGGSIK